MPAFQRLYPISKRWANRKIHIILILDMEQPRIYSRNYQSSDHCAKKRALPQVEDSDYQQPSPIKKLSKNFENSVGFSETNFTCSKHLSLQKAKPQAGASVEPNCSQPPNFTVQLKKAKLIPSLEMGIARFKSLLPQHLSQKLSPTYENLLRLACQTDKILLKKNICKCMQSFENLKMQIGYMFDFEIELKLYQRINFLAKGHYRFYHDPLNNMVIGLPKQAVVLAMRKYILRKQFYQYVKRSVSKEESIDSIDQAIPLEPYQILKTSLFFPFRPKLIQIKLNILQSQFVSDLKQEIKEKENQITEKIGQQGNNKCDDIDILAFVEKLDQLFRLHKVTSIFKVSILECLLKQGFQMEAIEYCLKQLSLKGGYLTKNQIGQSTAFIINRREKHNLLKQLQSQL